jgi:hypothetical protein
MLKLVVLISMHLSWERLYCYQVLSIPTTVSVSNEIQNCLLMMLIALYLEKGIERRLCWYQIIIPQWLYKQYGCYQSMIWADPVLGYFSSGLLVNTPIFCISKPTALH